MFFFTYSYPVVINLWVVNIHVSTPFEIRFLQFLTSFTVLPTKFQYNYKTFLFYPVVSLNQFPSRHFICVYAYYELNLVIKNTIVYWATIINYFNPSLDKFKITSTSIISLFTFSRCDCYLVLHILKRIFIFEMLNEGMLQLM